MTCAVGVAAGRIKIFSPAAARKNWLFRLRLRRSRNLKRDLDHFCGQKMYCCGFGGFAAKTTAIKGSFLAAAGQESPCGLSNRTDCASRVKNTGFQAVAARLQNSLKIAQNSEAILL